MSKPFTRNITIYQGATLRYVVTWMAGSPAQNVDLTGCTARMQVRAKVSSPDVLLDLSTENGGILLGNETGKITIYIAAEDTAAISWKGGVYDLEIEFANGDVRRLLEGDIEVSPEVTRG